MDKSEKFDHKIFLNSVTHRPGVYQMIGKAERILYIGKAKNLHKRLSSYFLRATNTRIASMVSQIKEIQVTITHTEAEALILENNLIKKHKPKYNVLLRDDKSYPYIYLSSHEFPRLSFHRGSRKQKGSYFGPYPSSGAVRETLKLLQKLFPVRQCEDSYYMNRSRPCLQYQIERCTAPCVGLVSTERYESDVKDITLFLKGRASDVVDRWVAKMEIASKALNYEEAAKLRDQISNLKIIQERQYVSGEKGDIDIVAALTKKGIACIQLFFIRNGRNLGNKILYPKSGQGASGKELISAFITQYYSKNPIPSEIIMNIKPDDHDLLKNFLEKISSKKVSLSTNVRGERARWLKMAKINADLSIESKLSTNTESIERLKDLQSQLDLPDFPKRMECFDISHTGGAQTVASCVVFKDGQPHSSDYRRFNIKNITPGDDYAAMRQALSRHYKNLLASDSILPNILIIDGGKSHFEIAKNVIKEFDIKDIIIISIAKGVDRRPGLELIFLEGKENGIVLAENSKALHVIQHIRDEAHRFAITGHRKQRRKSNRTSILEEIPGIGMKRRQQLLRYFGGLQGLSRAGIEDIAKVNGISSRLAEDVYIAFHGEE
tara:strand:- start:368 stop:2188 length:1821 start_codon:yes stop_codon:yes gene_type:complete